MRDSTYHAFLIRLFGIAAAAFLVFLVGMLAVRLYLARDVGERNAASHFELVNRELSEAFLEAGTITGEFRAAVAALQGEAGLGALLLTGPEGVRYAALQRELFEPAIGPPQRLRQPSLHALLSAPFTGDRGATLSATYGLVSRDQAFRMVRDALFLALAFLLACAISLLLIVTLTPHKVAATPWPDADLPDDELQAGASQPAANGSGYGLEPHQLFMERLNGELERAAAYDTDLSLVLGVLIATDATTDDSSERMVNLVRELALLPDLAFAYGEAGFALILPETNLDAAIAELEQWRRRATEAGLYLAIGIGDRTGRHLDGERLVLEAEHALGRAMATGGHNLVAFRADPARYRILQAAAQR